MYYVYLHRRATDGAVFGISALANAICNVCRGKRSCHTAGGYKWRYANPSHTLP